MEKQSCPSGTILPGLQNTVLRQDVPPSSADIVHNLYKHSLLVVTTKEGTLPASRRQKPKMPHPILAAQDSLLKQTVSRSSELKEKKPPTLTSTIGLSKDKACSKENQKKILS